MTRKRDNDLWPMVMVPKKEWDALVRFLKGEEKVLRDSFGIPGSMDAWAKEYKKDHPDDFKVYEAARRAASRKFSEKRRESPWLIHRPPRL